MNHSPRPAIQLYSLRESSEPLPEVVRLVADAGFDGVEFAARFREEAVDETAAAIDETGIEPVAAHAELGVVESAVAGENDLLDRCAAVGCTRVVVPHISPRHFRSRETVRALSYRLADLAASLDDEGIDLGYHTMRHDLYPMLPDGVETVFGLTPTPERVADHATRWLARGRRVTGTPGQGVPPSATGLWNLFARTAPDALFFELEAAEVRAAGFDPAETLSLFDGRVPLVHLRDVAPQGRLGDYEDVPHGTGTVDFPALVDAASTAGVEWFVYEDELDRDPAVKLDRGSAFLDRLLTDAGEPHREVPVESKHAP